MQRVTKRTISFSRSATLKSIRTYLNITNIGKNKKVRISFVGCELFVVVVI